MESERSSGKEGLSWRGDDGGELYLKTAENDRYQQEMVLGGC